MSLRIEPRWVDPSDFILGQTEFILGQNDANLLVESWAFESLSNRLLGESWPSEFDSLQCISSKRFNDSGSVYIVFGSGYLYSKSLVYRFSPGDLIYARDKTPFMLKSSGSDFYLFKFIRLSVLNQLPSEILSLISEHLNTLSVERLSAAVSREIYTTRSFQERWDHLVRGGESSVEEYIPFLGPPGCEPAHELDGINVALHCSIERDHLEVCQYLISKGANLGRSEYIHLLQTKAVPKKIKTFEFLLSVGTGLCPDKIEQWYAVETNDLELLRTVRPIWYHPHIFSRTQPCNLAVTEYVLGFKNNWHSQEFMKDLKDAGAKGQLDLIELLLDKATTENAPCPVIEGALEAGKIEVVKHLIGRVNLIYIRPDLTKIFRRDLVEPLRYLISCERWLKPSECKSVIEYKSNKIFYYLLSPDNPHRGDLFALKMFETAVELRAIEYIQHMYETNFIEYDSNFGYDICKTIAQYYEADETLPDFIKYLLEYPLEHGFDPNVIKDIDLMLLFHSGCYEELALFLQYGLNLNRLRRDLNQDQLNIVLEQLIREH